MATGAVPTRVQSDSRIPLPGDAVVTKYKGRTIRVTVEQDGTLGYEGKRYKSLSAVAKAISGSHCNGFRFFRLGGKR